MKKTMARRAAAALLALVLFAPALTGCRKEPASADPGETPEYGAEQTYAETLFDTSRVHEINVEITNEDWEDLRANPTAKTKYRTNVTIDGEKVEEVSFSTKGNTSLSSVALDKESDRYSFKLNFGKYEKGQTYRGLNKLNLNNLYADATYMKDFISYELFREVGIDAPLVSYVWLKVNGEALGLYIAIEDVSESWLDRTHNGEGELYKPESEMLDNIGQAGQPGSQPGGSGQPGWNPGGMPGQPGQPGQPGGMPGQPGGVPGWNPGGSESPGSSEMPTPPEGWSGQNPPEGWSGSMPGEVPGEMPGNMPGSMPGNMPGNMPGGFGDGSGGASLVYSDDEISSYPDIFENGVTDPDEDSQARVIAALKALSEGDYDSAVDGAETAKYFAAHNFVLNYDSYTGSMLHNYYLYEKDGVLTMLPWDYNLAFGAFGGAMGEGGATSLVNTGIDSPLSGGSEESRPMWAAIAGDEENLALYHEALEGLVNGYFAEGRFEERMDSLYELLLPYIEKDPSAFYTAEEFKTAFAALKEFCLLRAESIRKQLSGGLATVTSEQNASDRVDASGINVDSMGSHGGGGAPGGMPGKQ